MKKSIIPILSVILCHGTAAAQDDIPLLRPEERKAVDAQSDEFNASLKPALTKAAESTVRIWSGNRRLAYGTVIGDGHKILTKWSEVNRATGTLRVESGAGDVLKAKVAGVYEDEDLAVLETSGTPLVPVQWSTVVPGLGSFMAAPQPNGKPAAFGVVSVLERNLRDTDRAYLGVMGSPDFDGPGVLIERVEPQSGAKAAGLKGGDIILKVGERPISGVLELQNSLIGVAPGSTVSLLVRTKSGEKTVDVLLGNRPDLPAFSGDRLRQMERMGGAISRVRDSFTRVIQTDMRPKPNQVGGPVVDLKGRVVGITMARADRTRSFVMPAAAVEDLLKTPPADPSTAQVREAQKGVPRVVLREQPDAAPMRPQIDPERMRQHLDEMQRLMDFMQEEMRDLEVGGR